VDVRGCDANILRGYDGLLIGSPTWGEGAHHFDFLPFDASIEALLQPTRALAGVRAAAFGGCDRAYRHFGRAIELIEDRLTACGANVVQRGLKIELSHNEHSRAFTEQWAADFVHRVRAELPVQPHRPPMTKTDVDTVMGISGEERARRDNAGLG
jgi:flavodoxin I